MKLIPLYPEGKIKALTFSYDDGSRHDLKLIGIFNRFGMKGTFNLNSGYLANENNIHADELKAVYAGHEIAGHGLTHPFLDRIPRACALNELIEDRRRLEKITGAIVNGFALPYGTYAPETLELLHSAGYIYSRTVESARGFGLPSDFLKWHPTCHHRDAEPVCEAFRKSGSALNLCCIWGHSAEFRRDNNWGLIENICAELARRDEVWYATNGEIVRYVSALRRLETSADAGILYNPSAVSLWFRKESGEILELKSGEMRQLTEG